MRTGGYWFGYRQGNQGSQHFIKVHSACSKGKALEKKKLSRQ
jgi:hypothetical protein